MSGAPRHLAVTALLVATAFPLAAQRAPDWNAFDRYVAKAATDWHVPGLAIAVVHGDSLVFARGYGIAERGKPARATEHTRFAIGSTTKAMTTTALAMLVDEGKLRWDDRVIDFLPDLRLYDPYATRELRHGEAGLSQVGNPRSRESARTWSLVNPASWSGNATRCSSAACRPGR